jgi:methionine sulfoxide reductase catalytic subunit
VLFKKQDDIKSSEITDEKLILNRRNIIRGALLAATTTATGLLYRRLARPSNAVKSKTTGRFITNEGEAATGFEDITNYNNFYEFSTEKTEVAAAASDFITRPWTVEVSGLAHRPKTFDLDELIKIAPLEDRVYRLRCVEAWSMVIPWLGFPLAKLLDQVQPMADAKFVKFITLLDPERMPNQRRDVLPWPYVEGLRMDEAMHPLTILAAGLYGKMLPAQNGAPLRLVVPWKYGFKSIKSIVHIILTKEQPSTTWSEVVPEWYGFYSNVNPNVSQTRWSQSTERRIGEFGRRDTVIFNGYGEQVAHMYRGMDLRINF